MTSEVNCFSQLWDGFAASFRQRLEKEREKQPLSYSVCTLLLNDEKLVWNTDDSPCGQWLENLRKTEPQKADLILSIIMDDVKFSEPSQKNSLKLADILGFGLIPLLVALAAMAICILLKLPFVITLIAELVMELIAIMVYCVSPFRKKSGKAVVEQYASQLDKFKRVISEIVSGIEEK